MDQLKKKFSNFQLYDYSRDKQSLDYLFNQKISIVDEYQSQIDELFQINNPTFIDTKNVQNSLLQISQKVNGKWAWFPWRSSLVHILNDDEYQKLRTSRNRNLVTTQEQKKFSDLKVAIAGLSVGSNIAFSVKQQGGGRSMKLSDFDVLSLSNINRIRCSITDLGLSKIEITRRLILEMDPYSKLELFTDGIRNDNYERFVEDVDVVIDEVDNLLIKKYLRLACRKFGKPLLMFTDNDDGVLIDYYPYHVDNAVPLFYGINDSELEPLNEKSLDKATMTKLASNIVGFSNISRRMIDSLKEIGTTLNTWPQLGTAATFAGVAATIILRRISIGESPNFQRKLLRVNDMIPCN
ncbi:MAG: ThiF family adenylyltransferase [Candidatus Kerfeldbacteria bacterium]|nr:ThiF family adenylyltransferase [Candidatus Kerfeldbacteria bacterium]